MKNYIMAENLKHKNTFLKKLILISPLVAIAHALILMPMYFTVNSYNWWYVILMPATLALIPAMINRKEDRKLKYYAVYPLDINLKKIWISKVIIALVYIFTATFIHMAGVAVIQNFIGNQMTYVYGYGTLFLASMFLIISNIWQIPFCLFLAKKFGLVVSVAVNTLAGVLLGIIFADTSMWLICPYSWGIRLMVPVMKILPNGVPAEASNYMISNTSLIIPCILSFIIFMILTGITAKWFSGLEVK